MTDPKQRAVAPRWLRPLVTAAAICLAAAGCATVPEMAIGPPEAPKLIPSLPGSKAKAEAFKKKVASDPFPEAKSAKK